jgi:gamma-glutamylcyclotransferase (GGCT)/AIG2-like uncharacterized protein YtfP
MEDLFVYGTLHDPKVHVALIGRRLDSIPTVLLKYKRNEALFAPYPVAIPDADSYINGWLIRVTAEELVKLDEYEGENYIRIRVMLATGIEAWVYCASPLLLEGENNDS